MISIWEQRSFAARADVAIVGGGLVGLFTALHHKRRHPSARVQVLERGLHPSGASVKNAGFACFGSPSEILADIATEGSATALARVAERWQGLRELRAELGDERIGYEPVGGHELFLRHDPLYARVAEGFDRLNEELHGIFGRAVYEWRSPPKGDLGPAVEHMAYTELEGALDSGALMTALLAKVRAEGVEVLLGVEAMRIEEEGPAARIQLGSGAWLEAAQVVVATNGYLRQLFPDADVLPARGQVVITSPLPGLALHGTYHLQEGYYYFRRLGDRVLLGGARHLDKAGETTTDEALTPLIQQALEQLLKEVVLPGRTFTIAHRWGGIMGFRTHGKEPLVARRSQRVLLAAGMGGMGVAIGIRVARRAAELIA